MTIEKNIILTNTQIENKIRRISYQIYEANANETEIILAGIDGNGYIFTQKIASVLREISTLHVVICKVTINKNNPLLPIETSIAENDYKNKSIILIDDVLNSGTTLIYGVKHFLNVPLKLFKTVVLVNRNHKKYPVKADFKGISLSTSIKEHVHVSFADNKAIAYLE